MALRACPACGGPVSRRAAACPHCGQPLRAARTGWGFEWKSKATICGWPLVHLAVGRDPETGRLRVARGVVAIGQFGIGVLTVAQFGVGALFGFGQVVAGLFVVAQVALGYYFALGQFALALTAIGQFAVGKWVLAQVGWGKHIWTTTVRDPEAVRHFQDLARLLTG